MSDYISDREIQDYHEERRRSLEAELTTLRSEVSYVRGHLEGYADTLKVIRGGADIDELVRALREDASRLGKLGERSEP